MDGVAVGSGGAHLPVPPCRNEVACYIHPLVAGRRRAASVAQLAEPRFCKPEVVGSSPTASSSIEVRQSQFYDKVSHKRGEYPSGQRGQTVNLVAQPSQVRILLPPLIGGKGQEPRVKG